jgi:hypothetical protein
MADVLFARGHPGLAARLAATNPGYFTAAALAAGRAGDVDTAVRYCEHAVALDPNFEPAHSLLTSLFLHGEMYFDLLPRIHQQLQPRTYVEIGVETGLSLKRVLPQTQAIGIDPRPELAFTPPANVRVFAETSDDFFARHDVRKLLGGLPVDLGFVDGLHLFEYALRDFMNLERCAAPGSTILIDDCFPHDRRTAQRERVNKFWSGDVWKLIVLLKKYRPELVLHTVAAPPTGLCIVRNLDPSSRFIADNLQRLIDEFMALDYAYLERDRAAKLNLFPNDWEKVRTLLAG